MKRATPIVMTNVAVTMRNVRSCWLSGYTDAEAAAIEQQLAKILGVETVAVRNYVYSAIEERLWRGRGLTERRTGFRFVRGSHGGTFVRDPDGTDVLPPGYEPPPERKAS